MPNNEEKKLFIAIFRIVNRIWRHGLNDQVQEKYVGYDIDKIFLKCSKLKWITHKKILISMIIPFSSSCNNDRLSWEKTLHSLLVKITLGCA